MKKLYRKGTVHPSPPLVSDHLSFLPATILTLTVALSPHDREVLAYLISCSSTTNSSNFGCRRNSTTGTNATSNSARRSTSADHPASFNCYCFGCYMSYWVRWDSSPNRQLIHEIIDAYEDGLSVQNKKEKSRKERRKNKASTGSGGGGHGQLMNTSELSVSNSSNSNKEFTESENSVKEVMSREVDSGEGDDEMEHEELGKGSSVRRLVGFLGEKIWGIWS